MASRHRMTCCLPDIHLRVDHPVLAAASRSRVCHAVDSANARILDMMEKRVEQRLVKVLFTLYKKFGTPLPFTGGEFAELAGTTTESVLRAMGRLRRMRLISTRRGQINILDPVQIENLCDETLWV